jgi:hypothetical protein
LGKEETMKAHRSVLGILSVTLVAALAFLLVPALVDSGGRASAEQPFTLIYYDGHMHTTRSDGSGSVAQIKATAQVRGLGAVIITDHCTSLTQAEWASLVAETAAASDGSFLALPAFEITGSEGIFNRGHMNAYNVADPFVGDDALERCPEEVWPDPLNPAGTGANPESLAKWADFVHSQGGIANHNHTSGSTDLGYGVNNIEIYNQSHVDDVAYYASLLGYPPQQAWQFGITLNNFAIYGERDVNMLVPFPGFPTPIPLRLALYIATQFFPPNIGQWLGSPQAPLNSWDDLLMAYVEGDVDTPTFGVANSDAHNTGSPGSDVGVAKNGLYAKALTSTEVYKAIKAGRSFATTGPSLNFDINGEFMGDTAEIASGGSANLNLTVNAATPGYILYKIRIVKNGEVLQTISPLSPTHQLNLADTVTEDGYYRIEVESVPASGSGLPQFAYSNPVFVDVP